MWISTASCFENTTSNKIPGMGDVHLDKLHCVWLLRIAVITLEDEPPTRGCGYGRHICSNLAKKLLNCQAKLQKLRSLRGRSRSRVRCMTWHDYLSHPTPQGKGRDNVSLTHAHLNYLGTCIWVYYWGKSELCSFTHLGGCSNCAFGNNKPVHLRCLIWRWKFVTSPYLL